MSEPVKTTHGKRIPLSDLSNNSPAVVRKSARLIDPFSVENSDLRRLSNSVKKTSHESHDSIRVELFSGSPTAQCLDNIATEESVMTEDVKKTPPTAKLATECSPPKKSDRTPKRTKRIISLATHIKKYGSMHDIDN